jgi:hypothetical protein
MMHDSEIDALAKGMVPFVREVVTDAMTPLAARLAELEARPVVPPELAEQVKQAIHLLHESPPIVLQNAPPRSALPLPPPRPSRIERTENGGYTLIYDEPQA